jgi:hypothetical protein
MPNSLLGVSADRAWYYDDLLVVGCGVAAWGGSTNAAQVAW